MNNDQNSAVMNGKAFPEGCYLDNIVRLLDTIKYQDNNSDRHERVKNLGYAYTEAAKHFAQPLHQEILKANPKRIEAALRTCVDIVVCCFIKLSPEQMANLSIYFAYTQILDDSSDDPYSDMAQFFEDLIHGNEQKHPWWRLVNAHFPKLLSHYGSFCALNMIRSTADCE